MCSNSQSCSFRQSKNDPRGGKGLAVEATVGFLTLIRGHHAGETFCLDTAFRKAKPYPMDMWNKADTEYWIQKEREIAKLVVDLEESGFIVHSRSYELGWTDDPKLYGRINAVKALVRAKEALPDGLQIKVYDGWRPWELQEKAAKRAKERIAAAHPDWTGEQVAEHQWKMAPPARIVPRFGSHRYGGAFDITLVDAHGVELDMGVPVGYKTGPEAALFHYQFLENPNEQELTARKNRKIMIDAMCSANFSPYMEEFWHWNYLRDVEMAAQQWIMNHCSLLTLAEPD